LNLAVQTTRNLLMVRPARFGPNAQTAASNTFQGPADRPPSAIRATALAEFDAMAGDLQAAGVRLLIVEDTPEPVKPDAVFPNNWITTHANGDIFLYPLEASGLRAERRMEIVDALSVEYGFTVGRIRDLSVYERENRFLEGTGSMVLDRIHRVAYAARSTRTHPDLVRLFAREAGYEPCIFDTLGQGGRPVYHTNVMLAIGRGFAVICAAAIDDVRQREAVLERLKSTERQIIDISMQQMQAFAGNLLEVQAGRGEPLIVLSQTARDALTATQRSTLQNHGRLLSVSIDIIERVGGGGARCMLAEIFLPVAGSTGDR